MILDIITLIRDIVKMVNPLAVLSVTRLGC